MFPIMTRRQMLRRCGMGMGALGLAQLLASDRALTAAPLSTNPLAPRQPHFAGKAKRVIHLFMNGGPSHVDSFDPKPALARYAGQPLPRANLRTERRTGAAFPSPFKFRKHGQSGIEVSELFPHVASCVDDICVIRSMHADVPNHEPSLMLMNCGEARLIRPSFGSWVTYGLGSESENLSAFVVMAAGRRRAGHGPVARPRTPRRPWRRRGRPVRPHRLLRTSLPHAERRAGRRGLEQRRPPKPCTAWTTRWRRSSAPTA
jgi:uncharacterized protein DUF1501